MADAELRYVDENNVAHYELKIIEYNLAGPVSDAISFLEQYLVYPDAAISHEHGYEDDYLVLRYSRKLTDSEIQKRERDEREDSARRAAQAHAAAQAEYQRLKAIFEPTLPIEQRADEKRK
jgi:hypothetical protein